MNRRNDKICDAMDVTLYELEKKGYIKDQIKKIINGLTIESKMVTADIDEEMYNRVKNDENGQFCVDDHDKLAILSLYLIIEKPKYEIKLLYCKIVSRLNQNKTLSKLSTFS